MEAQDQFIKRYYSISEVAKQLNVNASLIRFWEKEFDQIKPKKNRKGNRLFTVEDLQNLKAIYHLVKERGFTLEGARNTLKQEKKSNRISHSVSSKLQRIRKNLIQIKESL